MSKPTHVAVVWWDDAHFDDEQLKAGKKLKPYKKVSSGLLVQDNKDGVVVAQDWNEEHQSVEAFTFVPRGMVTRMRKFKIPEKK